MTQRAILFMVQKIPIPTYSLYERGDDDIITEDYYSLLD